MAEISARKRIWGWMMFDWATQPFFTLLLTFIFGPYFATVAAEYYTASGLGEEKADAQAQTLWSWAQSSIGLAIALTAPLLGAIADTTGRRMPWITVFSVLYVLGTFALWWAVPDGSTLYISLIAFGIGMIGAEYGGIFVNALLPGLGTKDEIGEISGSGFALGYAGGVLALFVMLLLFAESEAGGSTLIGLDPAFGLLDAETREGTRAVGPFTAIWFILFMIPFFLWVREGRTPRQHARVGKALGELVVSIKSIAKQSSLAAYLGSSMFYRDALNALYGFGGVYATLVLDWSITKVGIFGIIAAIAAAIFTYLGGQADKRFGPKPVIVVTCWLLILVCTVIVGMSRDAFFGLPLADGSALPDLTFFVLGAVIGGAGGALQAASRTMMVRHANPSRPTEAFGLYALSGKATSFLAPALIGLVTLMTESARLGLAPVIGLFILGLLLLRWVNPEGHQEAAWSAPSQPSASV